MTLKKTQRRILDHALLNLDKLNESSLRRELEMAVDAIVTFNPAYSMQFWKDVRLYGIDEAKTYLIRFIEKEYHSPDDLASEVVAMSKVVERIHEAYEINRKQLA